ncbi:FAD-dependent oxidoreductase [bacterium]|nr:FAD-dependent oxidoreductase [bacterium]
MKYDVVIVGAGASGISCAWNCAKLGLKTLIIEKNIHAGGLITSGLVIPVMKLNSLNINNDFYNKLIEVTQNYNASITYSDGNPAWFNPELLKNIFDFMLQSVNCHILYYSTIRNITIKNKAFFLSVDNNTLSLHIDTKYLVDATGDGNVFEKLNLEFLDDTEEKQSLSMRFLMGNVDCEKFSKWILEIDNDRTVTTASIIHGEYHFSTAYTWDTNKQWALRPYFQKAINEGILKEYDSSYFQLFSVACMPNTVAFNCPRLVSVPQVNNDDVFRLSKRIIEGRNQISRLAKFCNKYLKGFENAYISNISDMLGVRESRRIKGKQIFTVQDIEKGIKPTNIALASDYPIDIHSDEQNNSELKFAKHVWYLPLECLVSKDYDNLFAIGRCLSADFKAQAAVRTQANCFSMGEAVAKHIKSIIN